jgi:hypothetical protein
MSPVHAGLCADPASEIIKLLGRMVRKRVHEPAVDR